MEAAAFIHPCGNSASSFSNPISLPAPQPYSLVKPPRQNSRPRAVRMFRSLCRALPIFTPKCGLLTPCKVSVLDRERSASIIVCGRRRRNLCCSSQVTGTLFGYRKGRISLALQENSRCLPNLIIELALPTSVLMKEMSAGMVRIALECEKRAEQRTGKLLDESLWTMFCNGKKSGYGFKREASVEDLGVMELLRAISMGAGVLPGKSDTEGPEGEMAYMRANFEHVVGSRDSETLYMFGPDGNNGPELTIFFVRV